MSQGKSKSAVDIVCCECVSGLSGVLGNPECGLKYRDALMELKETYRRKYSAKFSTMNR